MARRALALTRRSFDAAGAAGPAPPAPASSSRPVAPQLLEGHVGYFLVDRGLSELKADLGFRPGLAEVVRDAVLRHPQWFTSALSLP